ncbi:TraC family protein, partial [Candidatus Peregrinibacteria bacterium]|nr:TraC family protein [Candidatus Peregrinibacteria bacterium]
MPEKDTPETAEKPTFVDSSKDTVRRRRRNKKAATQRFLPISEIRNDTVLLKRGGLRAVLEIEALNFNLKSETEQMGIINGYESFINTLTFPLQIVVRSRKVNIDPYLEQIREKAQKQDNELLRSQTEGYALFVEKIVEVADIMQKRFLVVIPYDDTEQKKSGLSQFFSWIGLDDSGGKINMRRKYFTAKATKLKDRVNLVDTGLRNIGLQTRRLTTSDLIELYYEIYNPKTSQEQKLPQVL